MPLHPAIAQDLLRTREQLSSGGRLLTQERLEGYYGTFRRRFGPEVLRSLDGEELLHRMHAHGVKDSLVYWLEFKDDEEIPAIFGSIAGGSSLKFGVYRRAETGVWAKGDGTKPVDISTAEAVDIARRHRDQLLTAVELLTGVPPTGEDDAYLELQIGLERVAPDVQDTAWGHKYLSMLFPEVLDEFHVFLYQHYNLVRSLQLPAQRNGEFTKDRYLSAGRYVSMARELDLHLHNLAAVLHERNGTPRGYWRVGTTDDEQQRRRYWPLMRDEDVVAVGWPALEDLSWVSSTKESKARLSDMVRAAYGKNANIASRDAGQLIKFVVGMSEGDRVLVSDGLQVLGVAEIAGSYHYAADHPFPHRRPVRWLSTAEWRAPFADGLRTSVTGVKDLRLRLEAERHVIEQPVGEKPLPRPAPPATSQSTKRPMPRLTGIAGHLQSILERKGQAVLYGPPGTGKTYWALRTARDLGALRAFGTRFEACSREQQMRLVGSAGVNGIVRLCSFHPEYGYEDFIEGYRPVVSATGALSFALQPGTFKTLCADASESPELDFFLLIDEINRGDIPRIFGELLTLLEKDKRGQAAILPASGGMFTVPANVFVIGTMNTADRSIALLDVALRRRFGFVELMPDYDTLAGISIEGLPIAAWLESLNERIRRVGGGDARNRQVGHAFFLEAASPITSIDKFIAVLRDDVVPLLEEYCYEDFYQLQDILGASLVDRKRQRIRKELFRAERAADLIAALLWEDVVNRESAVVAAVDDLEDETDGDGDTADVEP